HPYTWGLLASIPRVDQPRPRRLPSIAGAPPSLINLPRGCAFRPRCKHAFERCAEEPPLAARNGRADHLDRCWLPAGEKRLRRASRQTTAIGAEASAGAPSRNGRRCSTCGTSPTTTRRSGESLDVIARPSTLSTT